MTRQQLSQVYYLNKELKMWETKLAEYKNSSIVKAQQLTGMPFAPAGNVSDPTFERIAKIVELQSEIDAFRLNIENQKAEIEKYIMTLDDSLLRQIIEYRCCQLKTWEQTAAMIGYGTTADSIRKYFNRRFPKK